MTFLKPAILLSVILLLLPAIEVMERVKEGPMRGG
jgi:hypothetical protein